MENPFAKTLDSQIADFAETEKAARKARKSLKKMKNKISGLNSQLLQSKDWSPKE